MEEGCVSQRTLILQEHQVSQTKKEKTVSADFSSDRYESSAPFLRPLSSCLHQQQLLTCSGLLPWDSAKGLSFSANKASTVSLTASATSSFIDRSWWIWPLALSFFSCSTEEFCVIINQQQIHSSEHNLLYSCTCSFWSCTTLELSLTDLRGKEQSSQVHFTPVKTWRGKHRLAISMDAVVKTLWNAEQQRDHF